MCCPLLLSSVAQIRQKRCSGPEKGVISRFRESHSCRLVRPEAVQHRPNLPALHRMILNKSGFALGFLFLCLGNDLTAEKIDFNSHHTNLTISAVRIDEPIVLDGRLDEADWEKATPAGNFIQRIPMTGEPATEPTVVRLLYDSDNLYVGADCFDSAGPKGITVNDIRQDFFTIDSDGFQVVLDTYDDNRNAYLFGTNPRAGRFDMQIGADGNAGNTSWDGVWQIATQITEAGWHVEMAIPFKTLRFRKENGQQWGINFERRVRRKYEDSYWAPIPPPYRLGRVSLAGGLEGLDNLQQGRNLYVTPYVKGDLAQREDDDLDFLSDAGLDVKYGLTSQLTLDLSLNTDFSQVEADVQQINLTRFSLFFPEKRDFFLENAHVFEWGRRERSYRWTPDLLPFFSRRIGLNEDGEILPILGGARLTGRTGPYSMGLLSMQTGEFEQEPSTNFTVARLRRDILSQSDIGGIFVSKSETGGSYNRTYGFDGSFNFFQYLDLNSYILKTETPDLLGKDIAGDVEINWVDGFFEVKAAHLIIEENFNPEVGFAPRTGIKKSKGEFGITPRPEGSIPWIRELNPQVEVDYITNTAGVLETRTLEGRFMVTFNDSSRLSIGRNGYFERLDEPFEIREDLNIDPGDYKFSQNSLYYRTNRSKPLSFEGWYRSGGFWDGDRDSYYTGINFQPSYRFGAQFNWSRYDVDLSNGSFTTDLVGTRLNYSFSNRMFLNALIQYNSDEQEVSSNLRFHFIYKPLSDLYVVYNDRRSRQGDPLERALIVKLTYMFAF